MSSDLGYSSLDVVMEPGFQGTLNLLIEGQMTFHCLKLRIKNGNINCL